MWCELVMLPNMPTAVYPAAVSGPTTPTLTTPTASNFPSPYPSLPAVTGVPINKDLKLSLGSSIPMLPQSSSSSSSSQKVDTSKHYHIFVGDLAPEVESSFLKDAFSVFGTVTECKIIKDMHTQKPKGYGFVAYAEKEPAEEAMIKMNGQMIGSRTIRTNWAVRRPPQTPGKDQKPLNYDEVNQAASPSNCTVYVGGITKGLCDELLRESFKEFGIIQEVRIFKEKGYAFVRFDSHEAATKAIITMHGKDVGGQPCKCSWGKESNDSKDDAQTLLNPYNYYANQLGFGYNPVGYIPPQLSYTVPNYGSSSVNSGLPIRSSSNLLNTYALAQQAAAAAAANQTFTNGAAVGGVGSAAAGNTGAYPFSSATALSAGLGHQSLASLQYA